MCYHLYLLLSHGHNFMESKVCAAKHAHIYLTLDRLPKLSFI